MSRGSLLAETYPCLYRKDTVLLLMMTGCCECKEAPADNARNRVQTVGKTGPSSPRTCPTKDRRPRVCHHDNPDRTERRSTQIVGASSVISVFEDISQSVRGTEAPGDSNDVRIPLPKALSWPVFADNHCD